MSRHMFRENALWFHPSGKGRLENCHFSSNNYNSQQSRQNTHKNFKNHLQDITLHSYIQYSGLIALSTICFVLLSTETHSTDTGLDHILHRFTSLAVPQLQFSITLSSTLALSISCCPLAFYAAYCTLEPSSLFQS